jgi:hypothetical protein
MYQFWKQTVACFFRKEVTAYSVKMQAMCSSNTVTFACQITGITTRKILIPFYYVLKEN